eukprot:5113123-Prymnesium_polylepis.1
MLQGAKEAYVKGFAEGHPKVAWALEGMAKTHAKMHNMRAAEECWDEAVAIRRNLQGKDTGKQMFSKELENAMKLKAE